MHEQTQRFILLLIFYLFGPILTLGIVGGIVVRKLPSQARSWERSLSKQTGLHWTIESVEYCSPGFIRLHSVKILDETAKRTVFNARRVDIRLITDTRRARIFPGIPPTEKSTGLTGLLKSTFPSFDFGNQFWQITIPASILDLRNDSQADSVLLVQNILQKLFARFESLSEMPVRFIFEEIAVASNYNSEEEQVDMFRFVQGNIYRMPMEVRSDWDFLIKDHSEFDKVHLSFALAVNDTLQISFQTGRQPLPCDLAAVFCSMFKHFSGGSFLGKFTLSTRNGNNALAVQMEDVAFKNVPLAPLVGQYTHFAVTGTVADFQIKQAEFGTESPYAEGNLFVSNGSIASALFHRCVDKFQLLINDASILDSPMPMIPFTACVIHFRLQPQGIDFWADKGK
jgi:hypothetical protein